MLHPTKENPPKRSAVSWNQNPYPSPSSARHPVQVELSPPWMFQPEVAHWAARQSVYQESEIPWML